MPDKQNRIPVVDEGPDLLDRSDVEASRTEMLEPHERTAKGEAEDLLMHELSVAVDMVQQIEEALYDEDARRVIRVNIIMGALSGIVPSAFELVFPLAADGTRVQGAELAIEEVRVCLFCRDCSEYSMPGIPVMVCPTCGSYNVEVSDGRDFQIESVEVV
jgi:hydrogenase nickel incorporation protein HypA/HybF